MEYIILNQAMRNVIPFVALIREVSFIFDIYLPNPEVFSKVSKNNQSFISVAESNCFLPITKHISNKHHQFQRLSQKKLLGYVTLIQEKN